MSLRAGHSNATFSPRTAVVASGEDPGVIPGGLRVLALSAKGTLDAESGWPVAPLPDRRDACRSRPALAFRAGYVFSVALSLSSIQWRRGLGRGGAARKPPSPTLPPLVPRGERESSIGLNGYSAGMGAPELFESEPALRWPEFACPLSGFDGNFR